MFQAEKKYAVLGLARSGIAAAYKINSLGGKAFLSDAKPEHEIPHYDQLKLDFECESGGHSDRLMSFDEWIVSPGISLKSEIVRRGEAHGIKMISELEFGFQVMNKDSKIIAVTGTNGKSTTASLIGHIIANAGRKSILAGNIGDAFCAFPIEKPGYEFIVLEVSSFQLDLVDTFKPDIALLLNITPDHLDRYESFSEYALSKVKVFQNQTDANHAVLNMDSDVISSLENMIPSKRHYFTFKDKFTNRKPDIMVKNRCIEYDSGHKQISLDDLQIKGPHNWANAMASVLACDLAGISYEDVCKGLKSFNPLKHRLQYVNSINGVTFYNDSKATNTDSVKYALQSFDKPIRIIMGGSDKGEDFSVLTELLQKHAKKLYITGETSEKMKQAWEKYVLLVVIDSFELTVHTAFHESESGDVVILSPACASFDKFNNFEHRGDTYINIVNKIASEHEKAK